MTTPTTQTTPPDEHEHADEISKIKNTRSLIGSRLADLRLQRDAVRHEGRMWAAFLGRGEAGARGRFGQAKSPRDHDVGLHELNRCDDAYRELDGRIAEFEGALRWLDRALEGPDWLESITF